MNWPASGGPHDARVFSASRRPWLVAGLAFLVPLGFAAFTVHAWEDYFITLRSSRNLVEGHGLVFNPGEKVHTFTSPLGVLLPALCTWLVGPGREEAALWLFRFLNAGFLAAGAALLWRRVAELGLGAPGRWLLFGLLVADAKLTDFSINGMETAILVFFLLLLWTEMEKPGGPRIARVALAVGGLMWTRPDAFILGAAVLLPHLAIRGGERDRIRRNWPQWWRGVLLGGLLYVPWFAWAWWYYGTPVPHTVTAKSAYMAAADWRSLLMLPVQLLRGDSMLNDLFMPSYWVFGGWPTALKHGAHALAGIAALAWVVPRFPAVARRASLALFLGMFYVCSIILFPWYVPPWTVLAAIALAFVADALYSAAAAARKPALLGTIRIAVAAALVLQIAVFAGTAWQMRNHQRIVETGVRRDVGTFLREQAKPGDTLFLEPLGYIGYFSQLKTYDFPGLSSPEVVAAVKGGARRYADIIATLKPRWVVLRPAEAARPEFKQTGVLGDYRLIQSWDAVPQLDQVAWLPGRPWVEGEARYLLFRRR